ncbi:hypothetical protein THASP1DRAFT_33278 [Thamnocephalis sphaerospora]|uniref:Transmembrane protein n=1 Tax=Thamnocephalis sphaerospora TaxID=78915 RepID=A0A4P9XGX2_9FUNG|nr:hypothetical protein THASP1DRAFT_33278 [Thamnocephalis sphaerospora]|eukprot:RKP04905.1 hypothetical protein THASP1DRAFT_33278 [Thamnocephalis sphaerospora]
MTALEIFIIVFLAVYLPVQLATLWVAWKLRRLPAIRHRSLSFTILIVLMDTVIVLHEFLPLLMLDTYPCSATLWIVDVLLPTSSVLWVARFYRLAALYRWNEQELLRYGQSGQFSATAIPGDALPPEDYELDALYTKSTCCSDNREQPDLSDSTPPARSAHPNSLSSDNGTHHADHYDTMPDFVPR